MRTVTLAPHEFNANLLFSNAGLSPFFGLDSAVKQAGGSRSEEFHANGERWVARLSCQDSNIVHPGDQTPQGTDFRIETIREYRIRV